MSGLKATGLGGTTLIEHMIHTRGHRDDYEKWAEQGNPGWSYEEVLPYFKKSEDAHIENFNAEARSSGGELGVSEVGYKSNSVYGFINASIESGLKFNKDYNSGDSLGAGFVQSTMKNGVRYHAEKAFLRPTKGRDNLHIKIKAQARKILIDPETKSAQGVEYKRLLFTRKAKARKEVIVSAGVYGSPQLLMLSGIGPKDHLSEIGIDLIQDLPVGNSLDDHFMYPYVTFTVDKPVTPLFLDLLNPINIAKYFLKKQGPYTIPVLIVEGLAFARSSLSNETFKFPDIELIYVSGSFNTDYGLFFAREFRLGYGAFAKLFLPHIFEHTFNFLVVHLHPLSKGTFRLKSKDINDAPIIKGNYLTDPGNKDVKVLIEGIRLAEKIGNSPAMKQFGAKQVLTPTAGCEDKEVDSDEFWECQIRHIGADIWHQVATCRMGNDTTTSVVDNTLRVHGMKNLRVVDASIIPFSVSAHTTAPVYMVAEKAADYIIAAAVR